MVILLVIVFAVSAILLCLVIMLQDDQGEGLGGLFGGGSNSAFGSRSGNVLTKATSVLAAIFLVTALGVAWMNRSARSEDIEAKARIRSLEEQDSSAWYVKTEETDSGNSGTQEGVPRNLTSPEPSPEKE
jgi:preprotein translocase subunit SecG